ncbi:protein 5NUC-like [Planococcus citri]|uniref:protein 5NUC-like n=1 Tax=Planococcus citri TaxID=170843 RepID=UPI0031F7E954
MKRLAAYFLLFWAHHCFAVEPVKTNFRLQILHNNDLHVRFVETDAYTASCPKEFVQQDKCYGGFARMKKAADDARQQAKSQGVPSIYINAGDSFQGTPYYTLYKWKITSELIDKLGLDVMTLGNHEFDDGIDNLVEYLKHVKTPVVCCNLNISSEKRLDLPNLTPSTVLTVEGRKIGVIGYLTTETQIISNTENLEIFEEIPYIREEAKRLKSKGIKIIIALGHSGFEYDKKIAAEVEEVSVVVGGHSHSLLYTPADKPPSVETPASEYPTMVVQKSGKKVPVVQAYAFSKYLGKLMVDFDDEGNVLSATGNPQILDSTVQKDPELDKEIAKWTALLSEQIHVVKGYTRTFLGKPSFPEGKLESTLANLITDAYVDYGVQLAKERKETTWTKTPIAFYGNGGIRAVIDHQKNDGALTVEDLMTIMPFENKLVEVKLRGSTIRKALEFGASRYDPDDTTFIPHYFLHFSGLRVDYDFSKPSGQRVASVTALCRECDVPEYRALQDDEIYGVITVSYLADGGDNFDMIKTESVNTTNLNVKDIDPLMGYMEKNRVVHPHLDNRVSVTGFKLRNRNVPSSAFVSSSSSSSSHLPLSLIAVYLMLREFL